MASAFRRPRMWLSTPMIVGTILVAGTGLRAVLWNHTRVELEEADVGRRARVEEALSSSAHAIVERLDWADVARQAAAIEASAAAAAPASLSATASEQMA